MARLCLALCLTACGSPPPAASANRPNSQQAGKRPAKQAPKPRKRPQPAPKPSAPPPVAVTPSEEERALLRDYEGKKPKSVQRGKATYYGNSLAGHKTASGQPYEPTRFTCAHRKLPFGTVIRVVRTDTNRYVYVRVTDRGPYAGGGRIIDLSYVAAERLGMIRAGVVPVRLEILP
jgi:rare lipoprotein A